MGITKKELYRLIDALPANELETARRFLEFLIAQDPAIYALVSSPFDDEPVTEKEDLEAQDAWEEYSKGNSFSHDDAAKEIFEE